ncbi:uncharacterized protein LOC113146865 [Cyclospora cayetanensis]|uniref:Uncharacterized protein LOC113146865 n=1 Tax=Cyclospora cayetanensis TaxID=88456 RepID=A0A6P6RVX0_9EIME|nr:uncharacterized protein LOC113146865 [Cyclospora cayetanensis]
MNPSTADALHHSLACGDSECLRRSKTPGSSSDIGLCASECPKRSSTPRLSTNSWKKKLLAQPQFMGSQRNPVPAPAKAIVGASEAKVVAPDCCKPAAEHREKVEYVAKAHRGRSRSYEYTRSSGNAVGAVAQGKASKCSVSLSISMPVSGAPLGVQTPCKDSRIPNAPSQEEAHSFLGGRCARAVENPSATSRTSRHDPQDSGPYSRAKFPYAFSVSSRAVELSTSSHKDTLPRNVSQDDTKITTFVEASQETALQKPSESSWPANVPPEILVANGTKERLENGEACTQERKLEGSLRSEALMQQGQLTLATSSSEVLQLHQQQHQKHEQQEVQIQHQIKLLKQLTLQQPLLHSDVKQQQLLKQLKHQIMHYRQQQKQQQHLLQQQEQIEQQLHQQITLLQLEKQLLEDKQQVLLALQKQQQSLHLYMGSLERTATGLNVGSTTETGQCVLEKNDSCGPSGSARRVRKNPGSPQPSKFPVAYSGEALQRHPGKYFKSPSSKIPVVCKKGTRGHNTQKRLNIKTMSSGVALEKVDPRVTPELQTSSCPPRLIPKGSPRPAKSTLRSTPNGCSAVGTPISIVDDCCMPPSRSLVFPVEGCRRAPTKATRRQSDSLHILLKPRGSSGNSKRVSNPISVSVDVRLGVRQLSRHGRSLEYTTWQRFLLGSSTTDRSPPLRAPLGAVQDFKKHGTTAESQVQYIATSSHGTGAQTERVLWEVVKTGKEVNPKGSPQSKGGQSEVIRLELPVVGGAKLGSLCLLGEVRQRTHSFCGAPEEEPCGQDCAPAHNQQQPKLQQDELLALQHEEKETHDQNYPQVVTDKKVDGIPLNESLYGDFFCGVPLKSPRGSDWPSEAHSIESFGSIYGPPPLTCPF